MNDKTDRQYLEAIASMTLWGEPIKDEELRKEFIESAEYDAEEDQFNPSSDTECTMLRDAVETARSALERPDITAELLEALAMALDALNTAPRFRVHCLDTDSYAIAVTCGRAIAKAKGE